jgi:hypothetical protein
MNISFAMAPPVPSIWAPLTTMPSPALLDHARVEVRVFLLVRGLGAVDVGRGDDVGRIKIRLAEPGVVPHDIVREALPLPREEIRAHGESGDEARHVVRRAAHEAERGVGPEPVRAATRREILRRLRDEEALVDGLAGGRRRKGHHVAVLGRGREVVEMRDAPHGAVERRVLGDVRHPLPVDVDGPAVLEARDVLSARSDHR